MENPYCSCGLTGSGAAKISAEVAVLEAEVARRERRIVLRRCGCRPRSSEPFTSLPFDVHCPPAPSPPLVPFSPLPSPDSLLTYHLFSPLLSYPRPPHFLAFLSSLLFSKNTIRADFWS